MLGRRILPPPRPTLSDSPREMKALGVGPFMGRRACSTSVTRGERGCLVSWPIHSHPLGWEEVLWMDLDAWRVHGTFGD